MNPETPMNPREETEMRITAMLMGELSPEEAAALRAQIATDPRLAVLHARLRKAVELLREASAIPEQPAPPAPAQLSSERRERLLAHFKSGVPEAAPEAAPIVKMRRDWSWAVPMSLAAALIAVLGGSVLMNGTIGLHKSYVEPPDFTSEPGDSARSMAFHPRADEWTFQPGMIRVDRDSAAKAPAAGGFEVIEPYAIGEPQTTAGLIKAGAGTLVLGGSTAQKSEAPTGAAPLTAPTGPVASTSSSALAKVPDANLRAWGMVNGTGVGGSGGGGGSGNAFVGGIELPAGTNATASNQTDVPADHSDSPRYFGAYWDTPRFGRYPGHPATTSLGAIYGAYLPQPVLPGLAANGSPAGNAPSNIAAVDQFAVVPDELGRSFSGDLNGRGTVTLNSSNAYTGGITINQGATSVTAEQKPLATLSGTNTYTGATTVTAGTLSLADNNTNTGTTAVNGGTLSFAGGALSYPGQSTNSGAGAGTVAVTSIGSGTVTLSSIEREHTLNGGTFAATAGRAPITATGNLALGSTASTATNSINLDGIAVIGGGEVTTAAPFSFNGQAKSPLSVGGKILDSEGVGASSTADGDKLSYGTRGGAKGVTVGPPEATHENERDSAGKGAVRGNEAAANSVMAQIREATTHENAAWASQPGMIRVYRDSTGAPSSELDSRNGRRVSDAPGMTDGYGRIAGGPTVRNDDGGSLAKDQLQSSPEKFNFNLAYQFGGAEGLRAGESVAPAVTSNVPRYVEETYSVPDDVAAAAAPPPFPLQQLDTLRYFLAASSRAPELNLFGRPRVSAWPVREERAANLQSMDSDEGRLGIAPSVPPGDKKGNPIPGRIAFWSEEDSAKTHVNTAAGLVDKPTTGEPPSESVQIASKSVEITQNNLKELSLDWLRDPSRASSASKTEHEALAEAQPPREGVAQAKEADNLATTKLRVNRSVNESEKLWVDLNAPPAGPAATAPAATPVAPAVASPARGERAKKSEVANEERDPKSPALDGKKDGFANSDEWKKEAGLTKGADQRAMVVQDKAQPKDSPVFIRGQAGQPGDLVPRHFLEIPSGGKPTPAPAPDAKPVELAWQRQLQSQAGQQAEPAVSQLVEIPKKTEELEKELRSLAETDAAKAIANKDSGQGPSPGAAGQVQQKAGPNLLQEVAAASLNKEIEQAQKLLDPASDEKKKEAAAPQPQAPAPVPQPEVATSANAFSTFSLNVSDVAFKLAAASLEQGRMPELATVRSEEFINAFDYRDPEPAAGVPLAFATERARYPFAQNRDLLRLSVKTAAAGRQPGRPLNIVLLLDNSGSMERADRVRILQEALRVLCTQLGKQDLLSVVTFARAPRLWADGVAGDKAAEVTSRVTEITPQGGTNIAAALDLGYATALRHYQVGSINRVVLLTDGAANLGDVHPDALKKKVEAHRRQGVALDCFGIGWEGYDDTVLEALSRNGDGRYGFLNSPEEAATEFAGQLAGALHVAASDVKVQVEFNPRRVTAYRQVGYAKHQLTKQQFRDNTVDAAEIGAAESGNALYVVEVNPTGEGDLATVRVRFKVPGTSDYREHEWTVPFNSAAQPLEQASPALRLAGSASAFAEWLVASPYAAEVTTDRLLGLLNGVPAHYGADPRPKKLEWMIRTAKSVSGR